MKVREWEITGGDSTHGLHLKNYSLLRDLLGVAAGAVTEAGSVSTYDMGGERIQYLRLARLVFVLRKGACSIKEAEHKFTHSTESFFSYALL